MSDLKKLLHQHSRNSPVISVVAGTGQVACSAVEAGADILMILNAGVYRNLGTGSLASFMPYGNSNDQTLELLAKQILPRSKNVPVIAGVFASDPTHNLTNLLKTLKKLGVLGVVNWPAIGFIDGDFRLALEAQGIGVDAEVDMLALAKQIGLYTFGFALEKSAVAKFVQNGVDGLILNVGLTRYVGDIHEKRDLLQHAIINLNSMLKIAKQSKKPPLCLAFGGPVTSAEDILELFRYSNIDGFAGGSVFERIPVQNIIKSTIRQFKSLTISPSEIDVKDRLGEIIGKSRVMQNLFQSIQRIAGYDVNVYIEGESGTGKELVASQIHKLSNRFRQPFVAMNCGAIPDSLLESELFGHEKGAFTSADRRRLGKFELANNGTLFLDEVADLSHRGQVALLRAIQQREITRVGGETSISLNIRILAASNLNLYHLVEQGKFRNDLYYRLNNIILKVPPLKDRKEDIPILVDHILTRLQIQLNKKIIALSSSFYEKLASHSWPGNVRELEHVICRAALLEDGQVLEGNEFFPTDIPSKPMNDQIHIPLQFQPKEIRNEMIQRTLLKFNGNKSRTAKSLGISRKTLYKWINEW